MRFTGALLVHLSDECAPCFYDYVLGLWILALSPEGRRNELSSLV